MITYKETILLHLKRKTKKWFSYVLSNKISFGNQPPFADIEQVVAMEMLYNFDNVCTWEPSVEQILAIAYPMVMLNIEQHTKNSPFWYVVFFTHYFHCYFVHYLHFVVAQLSNWQLYPLSYFPAHPVSALLKKYRLLWFLCYLFAIHAFAQLKIARTIITHNWLWKFTLFAFLQINEGLLV